MKVVREQLYPDQDRSFRIMLTPNLNDLFYWHFHPEYEIVYVEATEGVRHVGDHISRYAGSDLVFIGPNIPHLNFDYGVHTACEQVVIQMKEDFLGREFFTLPEMASVRGLFERGRRGLSFSGTVKEAVGERLKLLPGLAYFDQLVELLRILQTLASAEEVTALNSRPIASPFVEKEQARMQTIHHFIEENYHRPIDIREVAGLVHITTAAFCRYFKKNMRTTFTEFLNQYRINQAKRMLLHDKNVTEACYESGFENLSHFNKTFKKLAGENPSQFRKRHAV